MNKYFDRKKNRLVFEGEPATSDFWDKQWEDSDLAASIQAGGHDRFVSQITQKYITPGKDTRILEGGCGKGQFVYSLARRGYNVIGVDYAKKTIKKINKVMPELNIMFGDVRKLTFPDSYFDGYWSLGVIEHFYDGYDRVLDEMARVIKPGGYLFLTFPSLSRLRIFKAEMGLYLPFNEKTFDKKDFYQYGLDHRKVVNDLKKRGFQLVQFAPRDGLKGLKDEVSWLKHPLQVLYDSKTLPARLTSYTLSALFAPFSSHAAFLIMRKRS